MKLLLDTHVWLWSIREPERISGQVREALADKADELWLSPISVWEAILLAEKGKVHLNAEPGTWITRELMRFPLRDAAFTREVAMTSRTLRLEHPDPADRFIVASAIVHDLTLVTADRRLLNAGVCLTLSAT